ncbi:hypothetical protein [Caenispirillum bisanense]|uniref:Type VI secretion system protein n=1 Tax=Caenispirillum bisanense TaxID=414052 RepID=A0A286GY08_9PROT|nr:hypothetical protein [Caenispirillum bisanense]SOE00371.1 type VI secretion system protein [Caenispirillum bisanense]
MTLYRRSLVRALVVAAALSVAACAENPELLLDRVELAATPRANDDTPVAVDLVMVHDQPLVDQVLALSAVDWFKQRDQLRRDHPEGLTVFSWEVVPNQVLEDEVLNEKAAWAGIVFTSYRTPGAHRLRIGPGTATDPIRLRLEETSAVIVP